MADAPHSHDPHSHAASADAAVVPPDVQAALTGVFKMPAFLLPWADRFFEPSDLRLIAGLAAGARPAGEVLRTLGLSRADLERAHRRGIADLAGDEADTVAPADFHARYEVWAIFEGWKDVPEDVAERVNEWELDAYVAAVGPDLSAIREGTLAQGGEAGYSYVLLPEAEGLLRRQTRVFLWPCNCRAMYRACAKPVNVCLRFDNDRGLGWEISTERAVEVLREADRAGLTHTAYAGEGAPEAHGICNCCTDCCFPHVAARRLDVAQLWPTRRHRAAVEAAACTLCGRCASRCPFGALTVQRAAGDDVAAGYAVVAQKAAEQPGKGRSLLFSATECRGCGLCATGCPEAAIAMEPLQ